MKRIIVALDDDEQLTDEKKDYIERFATEEKADILGVIKYPTGLIIHEPKVFMDAIKEAQIDIIIAMSPEFVINELVNDGNVSKMFAKEKIRIIEGSMEMELHEVIQSMPPFIKESIDEFLNQAFPEKDNVLVVTTELNTKDSVSYVEDLLQQEKNCLVAIATIPEYDPDMEEELRKIIRDNDINKLVVYNDINLQEFADLLEELSSEGIEVIHNQGHGMDQEIERNFYNLQWN